MVSSVRGRLGEPRGPVSGRGDGNGVEVSSIRGQFLGKMMRSVIAMVDLS